MIREITLNRMKKYHYNDIIIPQSDKFIHVCIYAFLLLRIIIIKKGEILLCCVYCVEYLNG